MKLLIEIWKRFKFVVTNIRAEINFSDTPKDSKIDYVVHSYNGNKKGFDLFLKTVVHDYLVSKENISDIGGKIEIEND
jgi:hypothetical protein